MNPLKVILATLVIFASGVITGGLLVFHTQSRPPLAPDLSPSIPAPWLLQRVDFLRRIAGELDLSGDQEKKVQQIIRDSQDRLRPLWQQIGPQLQDELRGVRNQIAAELTPDQKKRFFQILRPRGGRRVGELPAMEERRQRRFLMPNGNFRPVPGQAKSNNSSAAANGPSEP